MEKNKQKKKRTWSELSRDIFIPLIPPAVVASIVAPIAIVFNNKGGDTPVVQETWTVTFDDCAPEGESTKSEVQVKKGETTTAYQPNRVDGYAFLGWKKNKDDKTYFDFTTPITDNITLYGDWSEKGYTQAGTTGAADEPLIVNASGIVTWNQNYDGATYGWPKNIVVPNYIETANGKTPITYVGDEAFRNCTWIESISLPDTIQTINYKAFYLCTKLKTINMPKSLYQIGGYAFLGCKVLKEVRFNEGLKSISDYAFASEYFYSDQGQIIIGPGSLVPSVRVNSEYTYIKKVVLPSTLSYLGRDAFAGSYIESIDLSNTCLNYLSGGAFYKCYYLREVKLPQALFAIGSCTFYDCYCVKSITIPKSCSYIYEDAFYGCVTLENVLFEEGSTLCGINSYAFGGCISLTKFTIPATVLYIGYGCFDGSSLTEIEFKSKLNAFYIWDNDQNDYVTWYPTDNWTTNCEKIMSTTSDYYKNVEVVGNMTDDGFEYLKGDDNRCLIIDYVTTEDKSEITIPATITDSEGSVYHVVGIDNNVFYEYNDRHNNCIEKINFGNDNGNIYLEYIKDYAFNGCRNLSQINIGECKNLTYIYPYAFRNTFLTNTQPSVDSTIKINLANTNISYIGYNAFCNNLSDGYFSLIDEIVLPQTLETLGSGAFSGLTELATLDFKKCPNLKTFEYAEGYFSSIIYGTKLTSIDLSACTQLTVIPSYSFAGCSVQEGKAATSKLSEIKLPSSIKTIEWDSLQYNPITSFVIPKNCESIHFYSFLGCDKLTSVEFEDPNGTWLEYTTERGTYDYKLYTDLTDKGKNATEFRDNYIYYWIRLS